MTTAVIGAVTDDGSLPTHLRDANTVGQWRDESTFQRDNAPFARRAGGNGEGALASLRYCIQFG